MSKYVTKYVTVEAEVCLDEFEDSDLIDELKERGYYVSETSDVSSAAWYVKNGNLKEALIYLERDCPELKGIVDLLNK